MRTVVAIKTAITVAWLSLVFMLAAASGQQIDPSTVELTAQGSGYYRVYVNDVEVSRHIAEREAAERAVRELAANPGASVRFVHDYSVIVTASTLQPTPTPTPDPDPVPDPTPTPDPEPTPDPVGDYLTTADFELIGGWRIPEPFVRSGFAIDEEGMRAWTGLHAQQNGIGQWSMPAMGTGTNVEGWPVATKTATLPVLYPTHPTSQPKHILGLHYEDGFLWGSSRIEYDTAPQKLTISKRNLATGEITHIPTTLSQPAFGGGFVPGHSELLIGCGGTQSGQGSVAGPTLAKLDGTILINQVSNGVLDFVKRERRPPNYTVKGGDGWVGMLPRDIDGDGVLEGAWASDKVYGGGFWHPRGICFFALLGTGELSYEIQSETGGTFGSNQVWLYVYDPTTLELVHFERWPGGGPNNIPCGFAVLSNGDIAMLVRNAWKSQLYQVDPAVYVYRIRDQ